MNIKIIAFSLFLSTLYYSAQAQFEMGLRMGIGSQDLSAEEIFLESEKFSDIGISLTGASYGYHFGLYSQIKAFGITFSPELLFNSNEYEYRVEEIQNGEVVSSILKDRYQYVDVPLLFGVKVLFLRAYAGPEIHYFVNNYSELINIAGFHEQIERVNYGAILGGGMNLGRLRLDLRYEANFDQFEGHIFYDNQPLNFNTDNTRLIFSLGWKF